MPVSEHIVELLPAYTLGSLEPDEAALVAEHAAHCAACQQELRAYQRLVDDLPLAAALLEPPAAMKNKLFKRLRAKTQPLALKTNSWQQRILPLWGLASLVLVVLLGASNLLLWQRLGQMAQSPQASMTTIHLTGSENTPAATGTLVISRNGEYGTLVVDGMPALDARQQYQLWLIRNGQRSSGGIFSVDAEGYGYLSIAAPEPLNAFDSFGVTIEPAGGSPAPTGARVLAGQF